MAESPVTLETLRQLAALAGLPFGDAELAELVPQAAALLAELHRLEALDLAAVEPALRFACLPGEGDGG
ncbi:MAG: hypothetical protein KatS3mg131_3861 [Candidatus Tectimicrobiota bacterium]|nr:MAG: hypothetical protein KatS3mg131_3861 [Candidatus Tectomicrobia bacterium]